MCSGCGQPHTESMAAENEFAYRAEAWKCHACVAIARGSEQWSDPKKSRGLMIGVHLERGRHG